MGSGLRPNPVTQWHLMVPTKMDSLPLFLDLWLGPVLFPQKWTIPCQKWTILCPQTWPALPLRTRDCLQETFCLWTAASGLEVRCRLSAADMSHTTPPFHDCSLSPGPFLDSICFPCTLLTYNSSSSLLAVPSPGRQ